MSRFFFHIIDAGGIIPDEEGTECPNLLAAQAEAKSSARDLARQAIRRGASPSSICVEIHDQRGKVVSALTVQEVMAHPQHPSFDASCLEGKIRSPRLVR